MIRHEPESTSEIARAACIAAVTVESAVYGEWRPAPRRTAFADVAMGLRVDRVLKGGDSIAAGSLVNIVARVYEFRTTRITALPGAWSKLKPQPGVEAVLFAKDAKSVDPRAILAGDNTFLAAPAATALPDVELALAAGMPALNLAALLADAAGGRARFGFLFARYVASRLKEFFYGNPAGFQAVLKEAENPETSDIFRRIVYMEAYQQLMSFDPAPPAFLIRLIWGSLRSITSGIGQSFAQPVLEVMLPNLLGLQGGLRRKSARELFAMAPAVLQQTSELVEGNPGLPGRERILQWLRGA